MPPSSDATRQDESGLATSLGPRVGPGSRGQPLRLREPAPCEPRHPRFVTLKKEAGDECFIEVAEDAYLPVEPTEPPDWEELQAFRRATESNPQARASMHQLLRPTSIMAVEIREIEPPA